MKSVLIVNYYAGGDRTKKSELDRTLRTYREEEKCNRVLVERLEGKRQLGTHIRRWEDTIKMVIQEVGWRTWT